MREKNRIFSFEDNSKIVEYVGCGAIIGAIGFTIFASFITDARPTFLMNYSPLLGGLIGGFISFILSLAYRLVNGKKEETLERSEKEKVKRSLKEEIQL